MKYSIGYHGKVLYPVPFSHVCLGLAYVRRLRKDNCVPAELLPVEKTCAPCRGCFGHAEVAYRLHVRLPSMCKSASGWAGVEREGR